MTSENGASGTQSGRLLPILWPTLAAFGAIGAGFALLPGQLRVGPGLLLPAGIALLTVVLALLILGERHRAARLLGLVVMAFLTLAVATSAALLVYRIPAKILPPRELLFDASLIWALNVCVFALWYWEIDCGGPRARRTEGYRSVDFVFPQFSADDPKLGEGWQPDFVDYLFLAFTTSTAFSPTDTMVLSGLAKVLMMAQSTISLVVVAVLLARAIGTI
ncbi:MAG: hypothetical protein AB7R89_02410 [Dehalococcoidia bacterium]